MNSTFHLVQIGTPFLIHRYPSQRRVRFKRRVSCTAPDSPQDPEEDAESRIERLEAASRGRSSSKPTPVDSVSDSEPKRQVWNEGKLLPEDWEDLSFAEKAWALYAGERGALYWANRFALAAAIVVGVSWVLFRFVGPTLGLYELKSTLNS